MICSLSEADITLVNNVKKITQTVLRSSNEGFAFQCNTFSVTTEMHFKSPADCFSIKRYYSTQCSESFAFQYGMFSACQK